MTKINFSIKNSTLVTNNFIFTPQTKKNQKYFYSKWILKSGNFPVSD